MKRFSLILATLLLSLMAWADAPAGYAIYGDVPAGYVDLRSAIEIHNSSETFSGSPSNELEYSTPGSTITFTGSGNPGRICENKADLLIRFKGNQTLSLTDLSLHIRIKRTSTGSGPVQISFCKNKWNDNRIAWNILGSHISDSYIEIILPFYRRENTDYNSWAVEYMLGEGITYTGGTWSTESRDLFRFCAESGETIEIDRIFLSNRSYLQSKGLGTLRIPASPLYAESSAFSPTGSAVSALNLYVVNLGDQVYARISDNNFDAGFSDNYQLRTWKLDNTENKTCNTSSSVPPGSQALFAIADGLFGIANREGMVSVRAKVFGKSIVCSNKFSFRGGYVNTPTGDVTAPTAEAECSYNDVSDAFELTVTASDDSGEMFYYVENTTTGVKQVSMTPTFTLNGAKSGDNLECYAVDFDGNMSARLQLVVPCANCFTVTIH